MYDSFYGLSARPFQLTPDPRFWFESATHRTAMSYLGYGLAQGEGFIVITGEVGSGKTTLVGHVLQSIDPARLTAAKLVTTQVGDADLLRLVADAFGIAIASPAKSDALSAIENFLHEEARAGRRTLLIVDEAQNLDFSALEELRMLSNFQLGESPLMQIFLLAQPEFRKTLASPELEQLRQRVIATHHLEAMLPEEIGPYIQHRLRLVGWQDDPHFTPDAFDALWRASAGVPRRLNGVASRLLLYGAVEEKHQLVGEDVANVVEDMGLSTDALRADLPAAAPAETSDAVAEEPQTPAEPNITEPNIAAPTIVSGDVAGEPAAPPVALAHVWSDQSHNELAPDVADAGVAAPIAEAPAAPPAEAPAESVTDAPSVDAEALPLVDAVPASPVDDAQVAALKARIDALEARGVEQDAAIRRILGLLIQWVEQDGDAPASAAIIAANRAA